MPPQLPPLGKINLVVIWIETLLYGANIVLFIATVTILLTGKKKAHRILLASSILLFSLSTAMAGLSLEQLLEAFTMQPGASTPQGPDLYFLNQQNPISVAKNLIFALNIQGQDWLVIWRFHVVIGGWWVVIPAFVECVHMAISYIGIARVAKSNSSIFTDSIRSWIIAALAIALVVNVMTTGAIAIRLWWVGRSTREITDGSGRYKSVIFTITESGAIYTASSAALTIIYIIGDSITQSASNVVTQLATIAPLLIIVRVGLGLTHSARPAWKRRAKHLGSEGTTAAGTSMPSFVRHLTTNQTNTNTLESGNFDADCMKDEECMKD